MQKSINNDGVPSHFWIELGTAALSQQFLRFFERNTQSVAKAEKAVSGWCSSSSKNLMEIDFAHAGAFRQSCFGDFLFRKDPIQNFSYAFGNKIFFIVFKEFAEIRGRHQIQMQIIGILFVQKSTTFTN